MMLFEKMLTSWILSLDAVDRHDLKSLYLNGLFSLHLVKFLVISLKLCHFLGFHSWKHKLCPLVDDFSATIGFPLYCPPVVLYIPLDLPSLYGQVLGLGREGVATILFKDEVEFMASISYLQKNSQTPDGAFRRKATLLCLFGAFLFVGSSANRVQMMLLFVVKAVHRDQTSKECGHIPSLTILLKEDTFQGSVDGELDQFLGEGSSPLLGHLLLVHTTIDDQ